ncbi:MAG: Hsp20/alpha crystallin family protein [Pseudomonadota bacterium]
MIIRRMTDWPATGWRSSFSELDRLKRQMDLISGAFFGEREARPMPSGVFPAINLTENKDHYYMRAELPGMKSENIDIQVAGRNLSLSGERQIKSEGENARYHRREREAGKFSRIISLPDEINADKIDAHLLNGVLTVSIAKAEAVKPKQITVK